MQRRTLITGGTLTLAVIAVFIAMMVFKVRVAVAGGKYVVMLAAIVSIVWVVSRALKK